MVVTRHDGRWTLEDRFVSAWQYLPVEVPPGACALRAELEYERSGAVMDLGCMGAAGFRGWSGGARRSFVICPDAATPGYLPGELEPGTWQVMIGLHRVPPGGAEYRMTVEVSSTPGELTPEPAPEDLPPLTDRPPRRALPAAAGRRWLAGDLHTHTVHSDGVMTVPELARFAAGRGMEFLAITDHNTMSHHAELPAAAAAHGIVLVPGQEVTIDTGHANALGDIGWIDFREPPDAWLEATEQAGGLLSVNHPIGGHVSWATPMKRRPPLLEVWHWSWLDTHWTTPLGWWLAWDPAAIPVGGSDWHRPGSDAPPGTPTTWVEAEADDPVAVLEALRAGRTAVSGSRDGAVLLRVGDELVASAADGAILTGPDGPQARVRGPLAKFPGAPGCHRLVDPTGATLALTG
ncbi:MAG TPA: CehA/McbA family metallohydrolase [Streptosporangiaceae bacterium]|nr:CehA/McbA family metallohydrolase [Streptosporangiaceae bacterium]